MSSQNEIRQKITDQILAALNDPTKLPPWRRSWSSDPNAGFPCNVTSSRRYTGINPMILQIAAHRHGMQSKWWGTYRQWSDLGGQVKRRPANVPPGQWGANIVFCRPVSKKGTTATGEETEDKFFMMRTYTVFNLDQVEGPFDRLRVGNTPLPSHELEGRYGHADDVIEATGFTIKHGGDRAFYSLTDDYIQMPHRYQFERPECYYETLFHEAVHMTEHPTRLNWDRSKHENSYAMGELIAELGGCYMAGELGLPTGEGMQNHASYLKHWISGLQNSNGFIFKAASQASRAVDHILSYSRKEEEAPEIEEALVA